MAAAVTAAVSFPSSKSTSLPSRNSIIVPDRILFKKASLQYRDVCISGKGGFSVRTRVTTEALAKVEKESKKQEEGVVVNKFKPKDPYIGRCLLNTKITGDDAPGETWHMVFSTKGELPYREGPFELNVVFAIINVVPTIAFLSYGFFHKGLVPGLCFGVEFGIIVFGMAYMFVHDGLVHKRFLVGPIANVPNFRR